MTQLLYALLLLGLRLAMLPPPQGAQANTVVSQLPEADLAAPSAEKAQELYDTRAFEEALPAAEEAVEQAWKEYGGDDYHTIAAEEFLAHLAVLNKDPDRAKLLREETDRKLARLGDPTLTEKIRIVRTEEYRETTQAEAKPD
jgi:hypothetical protein